MEALRKAAPLYEGRAVNVDHPKTPRDQRSAYDRIGWLENITVRDDGVYGDLYLLATHELTPKIMEAAQRNPSLYGLSHNADGRGVTEKDGTFVVEEITEVRSVDLVADPATNYSLFEGSKHASAEGKRIPDDKGLLQPEYEQKVAEPVAMDGRGYLAQAVAALLASGDPVDHELGVKVSRLLKPEAEKDGPEKDEMKESVQYELAEAKAEQLCRLAGFVAEKPLVASLRAMKNEDAVLEHLVWLKGRPPVPTASGKAFAPRSQAPGIPAPSAMPLSGKAVAELLKRK